MASIAHVNYEMSYVFRRQVGKGGQKCGKPAQLFLEICLNLYDCRAEFSITEKDEVNFWHYFLRDETDLAM